MTTFQVYGFRSEERGVVYCAGKWGVWMNTELSWKRRLRKP